MTRRGTTLEPARKPELRAGDFERILLIRLLVLAAAFALFLMVSLQKASAAEGGLATSASVSSNMNNSNTGATPVLTAVAPGSSQNPRRLSISTSLSLSSNLAEFSNPDHESSMDFELDPSYDLSSSSSLSGSFSISKEMQGEEKLTLLNDAAIIYAKKGPALDGGIATSLSLTSILPLSEDSRDRDSLLTSLTLKPGISIATRVGRIGYKLGITRHFHQFSTATYGKSNAEYGLSNGIDYLGQPTNKLTISISVAHANAWTYLGALTQSFRAIEELSLDLSEQSSITVGHRNMGSVLKDDGQTSNIAVFSEQSSLIYTSFTYNF